MSLHKGHLVGLLLIKEAVAPEKTQAPKAEHEPMAAGSSAKKRISEAFDALPERDQMIAEDSYKTSAEAAFDKDTKLEEDHDSVAVQSSKSDKDRHENAVSVDRAWREHEGFTPEGGEDLPEIASPGPSV